MAELPGGTITFLTADIEGSTRLLQRLGDRYGEALEAHRGLLRGLFDRWGGCEVEWQGDGCLVAFPRATDALAASVAIQRALAERPPTAAGPVRVRMGLHTGQPTIAPSGYVGLDVHRVARLGAVGHGGQILLSRPTADLVEGDLPEGVRLRDLGEHRLKDLLRAEHLSQVVIAGLPADFPPLRGLDARPTNLPGPLTSFIGRDRELAEAGEMLAGARLLTLTGPGGTGKTRLALHLAADRLDHFKDGVFFVGLAPVVDTEPGFAYGGAEARRAGCGGRAASGAPEGVSARQARVAGVGQLRAGAGRRPAGGRATGSLPHADGAGDQPGGAARVR